MPQHGFLLNFNEHVWKVLTSNRPAQNMIDGYKLPLKLLGFTVLVCGCSFGGAAIWQYEKMQRRMDRLWRRSSLNKVFRSHCSDRSSICSKVDQWWDEQTEGQRVALVIIGLNAIVFAAWHVPSLRRNMVKYFCSSPASRVVCWPLLLSTFSHTSPRHFATNMYAIYTIAPSALRLMGKEQFVAFYLTAGTLASLVSYLHKMSLPVPTISLGASGAIAGVMGAVWTRMPNAQLATVFFPGFTCSAHTALKALLITDVVGLIFKWDLFDHAAHLGGALFGIFYVLWGHKILWKRQEAILRVWNSIRHPSA